VKAESFSSVAAPKIAKAILNDDIYCMTSSPICSREVDTVVDTRSMTDPLDGLLLASVNELSGTGGKSCHFADGSQQRGVRDNVACCAPCSTHAPIRAHGDPDAST
jgi:hypothetical protein